MSNGLAVGERRRALAREALAVTATMRRAVQPSLERLDDEVGAVRTRAG